MLSVCWISSAQIRTGMSDICKLTLMYQWIYQRQSVFTLFSFLFLYCSLCSAPGWLQLDDQPCKAGNHPEALSLQTPYCVLIVYNLIIHTAVHMCVPLFLYQMLWSCVKNILQDIHKHILHLLWLQSKKKNKQRRKTNTHSPHDPWNLSNIKTNNHCAHYMEIIACSEIMKSKNNKLVSTITTD